MVFIGPAPIVAYIDEVIPGRYWSWRAGLLRIGHRLEETETGTRIKIEIDGPLPLRALAQIAYRPLVERALVNLSRQSGEK